VEDVYLPAMWGEGGPSPSRREVITTYHAGNVHGADVPRG